MATKKDTSNLKRNVVPDRIDLRDRPYLPAVGIIPGTSLDPVTDIPVLFQRSTNACTGFALASVLFHLQRAAKRDLAQCSVSPYMLYSMARRYDEFPGDPTVDNGSSLRGAMKGWYKHGACTSKLWTTEKMPSGPVKTTADDWWLDAVLRPLGAYYRIDTRSITDMHVALNEVGILYASAVCHSGWDEGFSVKTKPKKGWWSIPQKKASPDDGGHAFAIVGYNSDGFIIQNSWDTTWGSGGRAVLHYEDGSTMPWTAGSRSWAWLPICIVRSHDPHRCACVRAKYTLPRKLPCAIARSALSSLTWKTTDVSVIRAIFVPRIPT